MCKRSILALLASALLLTSGLFVNSCQRFDPKPLENRIASLEGLINDIKAKLDKAITVGNTVTAYDAAARKITLNDGTVIELGSNEQGGGDAANVNIKDGFIVITIDGKDYILPLVASVNSLVYCPATIDGIVNLNNDGAVVYLNAVPAVSAADLTNANFTIADAREIETKAGESLIKIESVELDGDLIKLQLKGLGVKAATTYVVSVKMTIGQYQIASNYFYLKVDNDFYFATEELVDPTFGAAITDAVKIGEKQDFWVATLPDGEGELVNFLGTFNFKDFVKVDGDVTYELAPKENQNDAVKGNYDFFKACLAADGTWTSQGRPGTNCAGPEDKPGILIFLKVNDVVKAKVYFKIVDPFADLDFSMVGSFEAELYARSGKFLAIGENELDIPALLNDINNFADENETLVWNGKDTFFPAYTTFAVKDGDKDVVYNDGEGHIVPSDYAKRYLTNDDLGVFWWYRGFNFRLPETIAENYPDGAAAESWGNYDTWGGSNPNEFAENKDNFYNWGGDENRKNVGEFGLYFSPDGILTTDATYTGWGVRLCLSAGFQYAYGYKSFYPKNDDKLGFIFLNRRVSDKDATMPVIERNAE